MYGFRPKTHVSLSLALGIMVIAAAPQVLAKESKEAKSNDKKRIAMVSSKKQQADKADKKTRVVTPDNLPNMFMQKNMAQLSDDEITRIKLIKRYEGVKNPRTDWSNGLRTLNWHYTAPAE